jgi:hypothetical protein
LFAFTDICKRQFLKNIFKKQLKISNAPSPEERGLRGEVK